MSEQTKTTEERLKRVEKVLFAGREDHFLLAWGRLMTHAAQSRWAVIFLGVALVVSVVGNVAFAIRWTKRDTLIFMKDEQGNVIPVASAANMTEASNDRADMEIVGFARRWVADAFTYNSLNVKDGVLLALRSVDSSAQSSAKVQLRLEERAAHRDAGVSVQMLDRPERGKAPALSIVRRDPLEVSIIFQRIATVESTGETRELAPMVVNMQLRKIPRNPVNPIGLLISDLTVTRQ